MTLAELAGEVTYHEGANSRSGAKHEFTLPVGIVELARELGGEVVGPANRLVQQTLPVSSAIQERGKNK